MIIERFAETNKNKPQPISEVYVVKPQEKTKLTPRQKKLKARKASRQSRAYNLRRAK